MSARRRLPNNPSTFKGVSQASAWNMRENLAINLYLQRGFFMKKIFNPPSVRRPFGNYNHGLLVPPGASLLVTSGQLGIGLDEKVPEDVTAQAELCFEAIKAILAEAEMSFADVIRISGFVTKREDFPAYMAVRDRFTLDPKPVSTLIIVSGFTRPEFLVEVEVTAAKVF